MQQRQRERSTQPRSKWRSPEPASPKPLRQGARPWSAREGSDDALQELVDGCSYLSWIESPYGTRVLCELTGHEVVADYDAVKQYLDTSKKVQRALQQPHVDLQSYEKLGGRFADHPSQADHVLCLRTRASIYRSGPAIDRHLASQTFRSALVDGDDLVEHMGSLTLLAEGSENLSPPPTVTSTSQVSERESTSDSARISCSSRPLGESKQQRPALAQVSDAPQPSDNKPIAFNSKKASCSEQEEGNEENENPASPAYNQSKNAAENVLVHPSQSPPGLTQPTSLRRSSRNFR
jgi:hypothetical protein